MVLIIIDYWWLPHGPLSAREGDVYKVSTYIQKELKKVALYNLHNYCILASWLFPVTKDEAARSTLGPIRSPLFKWFPVCENQQKKKFFSNLKGIDATLLKAPQHVLQGAVSWCFANNLLMNQDKYVLRFRSLTNANNSEGPQKVFWDPGFPLFEARDSGFQSKIGRSFGIKSMPGRWDSKNNPRDYGIERNFGSGLRDWRTLLGTLNNATNLIRWFP